MKVQTGTVPVRYRTVPVQTLCKYSFLLVSFFLLQEFSKDTPYRTDSTVPYGTVPKSRFFFF